MVFNIYYREDTGEIVGYQDGGCLTPREEIPPKCKRLAFAKNVDILDSTSHRINMKVDVNSKNLTPINLPQVIEETDVILDLESQLLKASNDMKQAKEEGLIEYQDYLVGHIEDLNLRLDRAKAQLAIVEITS